MKYHLHFAIISALNCSMYFFVDQISVCFVFACAGYPPHRNAAEATGKIIQNVTTAFVINKVDPYL